MSTGTETQDPIFDAIQEAVAEQGQDSTEGASPEEEHPEAGEDDATEDPEAEVDPDEGEEPEEDNDDAEGDEREDGDEDVEDDEDEEPDEDDEEDDQEEDLHTVTVNGETFQVTTDELRNGYQRQSDYTRDKQQLKREKQQVRDIYQRLQSWYEEKSSDPGSWAAEIVQQTEDPAEALADAINGAEGNAEATFAKTVRHLIQRGAFGQELVEALNLQNIAEQHAGDPRVERLEKQLQEREKREQEDRRRQEQMQQIESQWQEVVRDEGVEFSSEREEYDAKIALMRFAQQRGIPDLKSAWAAAQYLRQKQQGNQQPQQSKKGSQRRGDSARDKADETVQRKRKTSAMSRKPTGGPSPKPKGRMNIDDAAAEAAAELGILD